MTPEELQSAAEELFRQNNYLVTGPVQIRGASVDIKAVPLADPFGTPIFAEVTTQYVNTEKFGKDMTKFLVCREEVPGSRFLVISTTGFTQDVLGRVPEGVQCITWNDLRERFEQFWPYERSVLDESQLAEELKRLVHVYEEPDFEDESGLTPALELLKAWLVADTEPGWLIVVGEYGTGKTALSQMLLHALMEKHRLEPSAPIPVRIELRDFTKQFDSSSLLHKFLDDNQLGHVPIHFFQSLIRAGRVVLLLDGYDEMAQYMHLLERRACLEALAQLGRDGARGILTSRPNYFSEAEELRVLETLYASLTEIGAIAIDDYAKESALDELFQRQFIDRKERRLQDLGAVQTEALVRRRLGDDNDKVDVVLALLRKVSRPEELGGKLLGGKPVIISYLVELADQLAETNSSSGVDSITEYSCFRLIIDQLMLRDKRRSPALASEVRRSFLQRMAIKLSGSEIAIIDESQFLELVDDFFRTRIERLPSSERENDRQRLFADLRSSATLTRVLVRDREGWRFSHNSLREFLVVEHLLHSLTDSKEPLI